MISVSNEFKEAIKSDTREIYGYVDVQYLKNNYDLHVSQTPTLISINNTSDNSLISNSKIMQKYATLEDNYTLLDGSFVVWNENIILDNGLITEDVFENINDTTISIQNNSPSIPTKGITIYFKENLPFDFDITFTLTNNTTMVHNVRNNNSFVYQYIFNEETYISQVSFEIINVEYPLNRIRIAYIDFNLSDFYEGDELVSFEVTEELDLLGEKIPINNCTINLNNFPNQNNENKFDPINPKGITKYLTNNTTIQPYIGVKTNSGLVEYVKMGVFYLDDWTSDRNGNVTLNGMSIINKLKGLSIQPTSAYFSRMETPELSSIITNTADVNVNFIGYSNGWNNAFVKDVDLFNYLQAVIPYLLYFDSFTTPSKQYRKFYVNRNDYIVLDILTNTVKDEISRREQINDVDYNTRKMVKQLNVSKSAYSIYSNERQATIIPAYTHTLSNTTEYVWFTTDKWITNDVSINQTVVSGSASATLVGFTSKMICVKIVGTINSSITISCSGRISDGQSNSRSYTYYRDINDGDVIDINNIDSVDSSPNKIRDAYFYLDKPYHINVQTLGDPSLEIGDTISIQTRYTDTNDGYKNIIITKQIFNYDGGLTCDLEGVGD